MAITKKSVSGMQKRIASEIKKMQKARDELREWLSEIEGMAEDYDNAIEHLQRADEALSELV